MQKLLTILLLTFLFGSLTTKTNAQFNEDQMGAWYMYFWSTTIGEGPWGFQGDLQHRNWDILGDLEQLMLRGGLTYTPQGTRAKFTFGYANITTGEFGDGNSTINESRIYQELLMPQKVGTRFYFTHRFRFEQRFVEDQDTRTRWRYNIFLNVPFNKTDLSPGAVYLALYNELFINGERSIGSGRTVSVWDRNRTYVALGYSISDGFRVQLGWMRQATNNWTKQQLQFSGHHTF